MLNIFMSEEFYLVLSTKMKNEFSFQIQFENHAYLKLWESLFSVYGLLCTVYGLFSQFFIF